MIYGPTLNPNRVAINYMWAQRSGNIHGFVFDLGTEFKIEFYSTSGAHLGTDFEKTYFKAKKNVFKFLEGRSK